MQRHCVKWPSFEFLIESTAKVTKSQRSVKHCKSFGSLTKPSIVARCLSKQEKMRVTEISRRYYIGWCSSVSLKFIGFFYRKYRKAVVYLTVSIQPSHHAPCVSRIDCVQWPLYILCHGLKFPINVLHVRKGRRELHAVLAADKPTLQVLRSRGIINATQWGKLFPVIPSAVSSKTFDITVMFV